MTARSWYILGGLCFAAAGGLYLYTRHKTLHASKPEQKPASDSPKKAEVTSDKKSTAAAPVKQVEGDAESLMKLDPDSILGKQIIAKNDGAGIYTENFTLAARTKKGELLGRPIAYTRTSNGTYNLKYKDANGNIRIVNSSAVKARL